MERSKVAAAKPTADGSSLGFSLIELLLVTVTGALLLAAAGSLIVEQLALNSRMAGFERLRETWAQAMALLVAEAALSERMGTSLTTVSIPGACAITPAQFRFALMLRLRHHAVPVVRVTNHTVEVLPQTKRVTTNFHRR